MVYNILNKKGTFGICKRYLDSYRTAILPDGCVNSFNKSKSIHIMACRMMDAKPLSAPLLPYCQLHPKEHIAVKFYSKFNTFHYSKSYKYAATSWTTTIHVSCWPMGSIVMVVFVFFTLVNIGPRGKYIITSPYIYYLPACIGQFVSTNFLV